MNIPHRVYSYKCLSHILWHPERLFVQNLFECIFSKYLNAAVPRNVWVRNTLDEEKSMPCPFEFHELTFWMEKDASLLSSGS